MIKYHVTKEQKKIKLCDLQDDHLAAIIKMLERKARDGVVVRCGGGGSVDEMWYEEYTEYGQRALDMMGHADYVEELERRNRKNGMKGARA